jgi:hypothetical protein
MPIRIVGSRRERRLKGPRAIGMRLVFTLCTLGSALAQTTTTELREREAMRGSPQASLTQADDQCASGPGGPEGYACGTLDQRVENPDG